MLAVHRNNADNNFVPEPVLVQRRLDEVLMLFHVSSQPDLSTTKGGIPLIHRLLRHPTISSDIMITCHRTFSVITGIRGSHRILYFNGVGRHLEQLLYLFYTLIL
nr:MAG TPA: hypothetical protein [Caudoviricetes sp.]